jgi:protein-S-isoprenylcysteine O-methyltransferase Ste14
VRHLILIGVLPFLIVVALPAFVAHLFGTPLALAASFVGALIQLAGLVAIAIGATLFGSALYEIANSRQAHLAPWDPRPRLVIRGAYRRVRNPAISGVLFVLFGEALVLQSLPHALLALALLFIAAAYIALLEEPQIEARFGDEYRRYCQHVSRLVPRARPWTP